MSEKDAMEKMLETYNDVFSDILNVLLFHGERIVKEGDLTDETHHSVYKADGKLHEQERDAAKYWKNCDVRIALFGIENQTVPDADMPLRVIGYDGAAYRSQLLKDRPKKGKANRRNIQKRHPVVTLVLYFGEKHWKKPVSLNECLEVPEQLRPYVNDYRINLFEIAWLEDHQVDLFQSDFKVVTDFFVQTRKNGAYRPPATKLRHVDEVLKLLSVMSGDSRFEEAIDQSEEGKVTSMCEALDRIETRGKEAGLLEATRNLMETLRCPAERAMELLKIPAMDRKKYLSRLQA